MLMPNDFDIQTEISPQSSGRREGEGKGEGKGEEGGRERESLLFFFPESINAVRLQIADGCLQERCFIQMP